MIGAISGHSLGVELAGVRAQLAAGQTTKGSDTSKSKATIAANDSSSSAPITGGSTGTLSNGLIAALFAAGQQQPPVEGAQGVSADPPYQQSSETDTGESAPAPIGDTGSTASTTATTASTTRASVGSSGSGRVAANDSPQQTPSVSGGEGLILLQKISQAVQAYSQYLSGQNPGGAATAITA
jgi:hypothetical protein